MNRLWTPSQQSWGMLLLAIWVILHGAIPLLGLGSTTLSMLMQILAIAAGVLILLKQ